MEDNERQFRVVLLDKLTRIEMHLQNLLLAAIKTEEYQNKHE